MDELEWCREKLANLQIKENRLNTLTEIHDHLSQRSTLDASVSLNLLSAEEIYSCIDEPSGSEQETLACGILAMCLSNTIMDSDFTRFLQPTLQHRNWNVRLLGLSEICRMIQRRPDTTLNATLTVAVIKCLDSPLTTVGAAAIEILSKTLLACYDEMHVKVNLLQRLDASDIVRCRVYEIGVNLARTSPEMLDKVKNILEKMIGELNSDDILLKQNILEMLVALAEQNHGLVYLENKGVFETVTKQVEEVNRNPLGPILIPGYMRFFGKIAFAQPQKIITGYPKMVHSLFDGLMSGDSSIMPTALDTLGNLAHSSSGKIIINSHYSDRMTEALQTLGATFRNYPTDIKIRAFNAFEVVFKTDGQQNDDICEITKKWHHLLTGSFDFRFLFEFCKNPFPDIKIACLSLVKTLCMYGWGVLALRDSAGFVEYLLDRRIESNKDVMVLKWEINTILSNTDVFDAHTLLQLKKYVEDGVLYIQGIVEVAVDGS